MPEPLEDTDNGLSDFYRPMLADCYQQLKETDAHIDFYTPELAVSISCAIFNPVPSEAMEGGLFPYVGFGRQRKNLLQSAMPAQGMKP